MRLRRVCLCLATVVGRICRRRRGCYRGNLHPTCPLAAHHFWSERSVCILQPSLEVSHDAKHVRARAHTHTHLTHSLTHQPTQPATHPPSLSRSLAHSSLFLSLSHTHIHKGDLHYDTLYSRLHIVLRIGIETIIRAPPHSTLHLCVCMHACHAKQPEPQTELNPQRNHVCAHVSR